MTAHLSASERKTGPIAHHSEQQVAAWKEKDIPTKVSTETPADANGKVGATKALKQKSIRKDMKKAKALMARVSRDYPRRLMMEAGTPHQTYAALKTKYSVAKNRQDFTKLGKE